MSTQPQYQNESSPKQKRQRMRKSFCLIPSLNFRQKCISFSESVTPQTQEIQELCTKLKKIQSTQTYDSLNQKNYFGSFSDRFQLIKKIGEGTQGIVYKCADKFTGDIKAVKRIKTADDEAKEKTITQYNLLKSLSHKNILPVEDMIVDEVKKVVYLIFEYWPYGTLENYMAKKIIPQKEVSSITKSILETIFYLHNQLICHRDIRPQNILYNPQNGDLRLIDFQISKRANRSSNCLQMLTNTCDIRYKAPQMFCSIYNQAIDMWSLGIIVYRMLNGKFPFETQYQKNLRHYIQKEEPSYICLNNNAQLFIEKLLKKRPSQRMTAKQALQDKFIQKEQLEKIIKQND